MTSRLLCQSINCRASVRGGPRQIEPGRPLCRNCADQARDDVAEIARLWPDLIDQLSIPREEEERVAGTRSHGLAVNEDVSDAMRQVIEWTWLLVRVVLDETDAIRLPRDQDTPMMLAWLARWHVRRFTHNEDNSFAVGFVERAAELRALVLRRAFPVRVRRVEIPGTCIMNDENEERCDGTLFALVREDASLLPSEIVCDKNADHRIPSSHWASYGRKVIKLDQLAAEKLRARLDTGGST